MIEQLFRKSREGNVGKTADKINLSSFLSCDRGFTTISPVLVKVPLRHAFQFEYYILSKSFFKAYNRLYIYEQRAIKTN